MGRMPPKSGQNKTPDTSPSPSRPGPSTRRVTRSSPTKVKTSPPPSPRKRGPVKVESVTIPKKEDAVQIKVPPQSPQRNKSPVKAKEPAPPPQTKKVQSDSSDSEEDSTDDDDDEHTMPTPNKQIQVQVNQVQAQKPQKITKEQEQESNDEETSTRVVGISSFADQQSTTKPVARKSTTNVVEASESEELHEQQTIKKKVVRKVTTKVPEPKESEEFLNEGRNVMALMSSEEINELLERIDKQCTPLDTISSKSRENMIDWNNVAFSSYGPRQCQVAWVFLRQQSRKIRILSEVVSEVKLKYASSKTFQAKLVESMPGFPQKPPTTLGGFHYFNRQEWEKKKSIKDKSPDQDLPNFVKFQSLCKEKYNAMTKAEQKRYEELSKLALAEYNKQVKEFYLKNPGLAQLTERLKKSSQSTKDRATRVRSETRKRTASESAAPRRTKDYTLPDPYPDAPQPPNTPAVLFIQSKLNRLDPPPTGDELSELKNKFFEKWKSFSDEKRLNWINYCINSCISYIENVEEYQNEHPGFVKPKEIKIKQLLSKDEIKLWEDANEKPQNPKLSVFDLFYEKEFSQNMDLPEADKKQTAHTKWEAMGWFEKEMYTIQYKMEVLQFKKNIQEFFSRIPEFMKPACLARLPKRFVKMLDEVDKVPAATSQNETMQEEEGDEEHERERHESESQEEGPPKKKKKKKDKKKQRDTETEFYGEEEYPNKYEEDEFNVPLDETEVVESPKKKKKKKKKHREEEYYEEPETITGDIYSDAHSEVSEGPNHVSDTLGPLFRHHPSEEEIHQQSMLKKRSNDSKTLRKVNAELETMRTSEVKPSLVSRESYIKKLKPSSKLFPPSSTVAQNDVFEAVRGIFDGRAHIGRKFSVYYYYAKYVASEKMWIDNVSTIGLENTALKIIETFLSLNAHQKDTFINQSFQFYFEKVHGLKFFSKEDLPLNSISDPQTSSPGILFHGEPKPPPKRAKTLYLMEMQNRKQRKADDSFDYPKWEEADEHIQTYYIKKLYHETKLYMKRYDMFMSSMTPNDMVEYTVQRARAWENQLYSKQSLIWASKEFVFPLPVQELFDEGQESEPEVENMDTQNPRGRLSRKCKRQTTNPFSNSSELNKIVEKIPKKTRCKIKKQEPESDDDPSDDDQKDFSLYLRADYRMKKRIKNAGKYQYPLDDLFANNKTQTNQTLDEVPTVTDNNNKMTEFDKVQEVELKSKGTQVSRLLTTKSKHTQTIMGGLDVRISEQRIDPKPIEKTELQAKEPPKTSKEVSKRQKGFIKRSPSKIFKPATTANILQKIACSLIVPDRKFASTLSALKKPKKKAPLVLVGKANGKKSQVQNLIPVAATTESPKTDGSTTNMNTNANYSIPEVNCDSVNDYEIPSPIKPVAEFSFTSTENESAFHVPNDDFDPMPLDSTDIILL